MCMKATDITLNLRCETCSVVWWEPGIHSVASRKSDISHSSQNKTLLSMFKLKQLHRESLFHIKTTENDSINLEYFCSTGLVSQGDKVGVWLGTGFILVENCWGKTGQLCWENLWTRLKRQNVERVGCSLATYRFQKYVCLLYIAAYNQTSVYQRVTELNNTLLWLSAQVSFSTSAAAPVEARRQFDPLAARLGGGAALRLPECIWSR